MLKRSIRHARHSWNLFLRYGREKLICTEGYIMTYWTSTITQYYVFVLSIYNVYIFLKLISVFIFSWTGPYWMRFWSNSFRIQRKSRLTLNVTLSQMFVHTSSPLSTLVNTWPQHVTGSDMALIMWRADLKVWPHTVTDI